MTVEAQELIEQIERAIEAAKKIPTR